MSKPPDMFSFSCGLFLGMVVALAVTAMIFINAVRSIRTETKSLRIEAVERGFAEWKTETDGTTSWQWKEPERKVER